VCVQPAMTAEEREKRRKMMAEAALQREQAWSKKSKVAKDLSQVKNCRLWLLLQHDL
jgi:hypothetical protein